LQKNKLIGSEISILYLLKTKLFASLFCFFSNSNFANLLTVLQTQICLLLPLDKNTNKVCKKNSVPFLYFSVKGGKTVASLG